MKYQAPPGVTALFVAGDEIRPDANGGFELPESLRVELAAHGCVKPMEAPAQSEAVARPVRARSEKAV